MPNEITNLIVSEMNQTENDTYKAYSEIEIKCPCSAAEPDCQKDAKTIIAGLPIGCPASQQIRKILLGNNFIKILNFGDNSVNLSYTLTKTPTYEDAMSLQTKLMSKIKELNSGKDK